MRALPSEIFIEIEKMISSGNKKDLINYVRSSCADYDLTPKLLGEIFEVVASPIHSGYSRVVTAQELLNIH